MVPKLEHSVLKLPAQKSMASYSFPYFEGINGAILNFTPRLSVKCLELVKLVSCGLFKDLKHWLQKSLLPIHKIKSAPTKIFAYASPYFHEVHKGVTATQMFQ